MIPYPIAPLKDIVVLVTRPAAQALKLSERVRAYGGEAVVFPTIVIEPVPATISTGETFDWLIFTSANAVRYGLPLVTIGEKTRVAAIGKSTATALAESEIRVDAMPQGNATSETLLAHPAFATVTTKSALIVKGIGGRELLHDELTQRGASVTTLEVYRRAQPQIEAASVMQLEQRWRFNNPASTDAGGDSNIDIVTLTSIETLDNLLAMLTETGRALLRSTPFVTPSHRIADAARAKRLQGQCVLSRGADDEALIGAIAAWHARAR